MLLRLGWLVLDFTRHFVEQIFERDDPGRPAVLVEDHRHLRRLAPQRAQHRIERGGLGDERDRPHGGRLEARPALHHLQQLLDVDLTDDVIEIAVEHRIARVRGRGDALADYVGRRPQRDAADLHSRHHRLAGHGVAESEQLADHLAGVATQQPARLALLDDQRQLLG